MQRIIEGGNGKYFNTNYLLIHKMRGEIHLNNHLQAQTTAALFVIGCSKIMIIK